MSNRDTPTCWVMRFVFLFLVWHESLRSSAVNLPLLREKLELESKAVTDIVHNAKWNNLYNSYYEANIQGEFRTFIGDESVYVYELSVAETLSQMGNRLGHYFEDPLFRANSAPIVYIWNACLHTAMSAAKKAGMHFVGFTNKLYDNPDTEIILKDLPAIFEHPDPVSHREAAENLKRMRYSAQAWPWMSEKAYFYQNLNDVRNISTHVLDALKTATSSPIEAGLSRETFEIISNNNQPPDAPLPFIPSVTILFRCIDLINAGQTNTYGVFPFQAYTSMIPADAESIYVVTEPKGYPKYSGGDTESICVIIRQQLVEFLQEKYPQAMVATRRGYPLDSFVQQSSSSVTICCASSFCLFPSLINPNPVYIMQTELLASGRVSFGPNVHFVKEPLYYVMMVQELLGQENAKLYNQTAIAHRMAQIMRYGRGRDSHISDQLLGQPVELPPNVKEVRFDAASR